MTIESSSAGKSGWNLASGDSTTVRKYVAGKWSDPVNVQVAQLDLLEDIDENLTLIRKRVGFLVLIFLLTLVAPIFLLSNVWGTL